MPDRLPSRGRIALIVSIIGLLVMSLSGTVQAATGPGYYFGFTPFPYDSTAKAYLETRKVIVPNSNLFALHYDDCVPWQAALDDTPFPPSIGNKWRDDARSIPADHVVYVGLAPLAKDRKSLAPSCGRMPKAFRHAPMDDPAIVKAYINYARRAIVTFKPRFLNVGIEVGEVMTRDLRRWHAFERLYAELYKTLKRDYPDVQIGVSFGLQSLREPRNARLARPVVDQSDYLGLSFYPHASAFGEKLGQPALGRHPDSWRKALDWVGRYTDKPIAIAETGFSSRDIRMPHYGLFMKGNETWQAQYVHDLLQRAKDRHYLFVVWFLAIDYDDLYERMPKTPENQANLLWRNIGLFDGRRRPKPAWFEWLRMNGLPGAVPVASQASAIVASPPAAQTGGLVLRLGFDSATDLLSCDPASRVDWQATSGHAGRGAMRWRYDYGRKDWKWCVGELARGRLAQADSLVFWLKAERSGRLFIQLEEAGGETFFTTVDMDGSWRRVALPLDSFGPDPAKRQDGRLDKARIVKLLLADFDDRRTGKVQQTVWLSDMGFHSVTAGGGEAPTVGKGRAVRPLLNLTSPSGLPTCAPTSQVDLVSAGQGPVLRWRYPRRKGEWQWCLKELPRATLAGRETLKIRFRSDHEGALFLQLQERDGEAFFTLLDVGTDWRTKTIPLATFTVDPQKKRDGRLDPADVSQWLIADAQSDADGDGTRTVWISEMSVE